MMMMVSAQFGLPACRLRGMQKAIAGQLKAALSGLISALTAGARPTSHYFPAGARTSLSLELLSSTCPA